MKRTISIFALLFAIWSCNLEKGHKESSDTPGDKEVYQSAEVINALNRGLTRVVSEDLFPPPVASRIYAYCNISAFEAVRQNLASISSKMNGFPAIDAPCEGQCDKAIGMVRAFTETAKSLVYRDALIDSLYIDIIQAYFPENSAVLEASEKYGDELAKQILSRSVNDGYDKTRNLPKYNLKIGRYAWRPTSPLFGEALEPYWFRLEPFLMDSSSQFRADLEIEFDTVVNSEFYNSAKQVLEITNAADSLDVGKAVYWDCNPGPTLVEGHEMQVRKQNTPGGHWLGIQAILAMQTNQNLESTAAVNAKLTAGIADAFIAAWDTKFHYNLLRPETYINRYIDKDWKPKLESPLFPEYTSAHSLVSATSATILTEYYGDLSFYDDTNVFFGLPPKQFNSIWQAAREAARSRLLGGIHYEFACDGAFEQGQKLGMLFNEEIPIDQ